MFGSFKKPSAIKSYTISNYWALTRFYVNMDTCKTVIKATMDGVDHQYLIGGDSMVGEITIEFINDDPWGRRTLFSGSMMLREIS